MSIAQIESGEPSHTYTCCCSPKTVLITAVALVALGAIGVGILSLDPSLAPAFSKPYLSMITPLYSGILVGGGGSIVVSFSLYGLYALCSAPKVEEIKERVVEEKPAAPPPQPRVEEEVVVPPPPSVAILPAPHVREVPPPPISLSYAMRLFKNYHEDLAKKYHNNENLSYFLEVFFKPYQKTVQIENLIAIQKVMEQEESSLDDVMKRYRAWLEGDQQEPFVFFGLIKEGERLRYELIRFDSTHHYTENDLKTYLEAVQQYHLTQKESPLFERHECKKNSLRHLVKLLPTNDEQKAHKKMYLMRVLRKVLEDHPNWKQDADFKVWLSSSLLYLKKGLPQPTFRDSQLKEQWRAFLHDLSTLSQEVVSLKTPSKPVLENPNDYKPLSLEHVQKSAIIPYLGVKEAEGVFISENGGISSLKAPEGIPQFQGKQDLILLREWRSHFFDLYNKNAPPQNLETEIALFLNKLPTSSSINTYFQGLSDEEKKESAHLLYEIANLGLTQHVALGRTAPHASRFLGMVKTQELLIAMIQNIPELFMRGLTFYTQELYWILSDPYFDLGPYQTDIFLTLERIQKLGENGDVDLRKIGHEYFPASFHLALCKRWKYKKEDVQSYKEYLTQEEQVNFQNDFTGQYIPQLVGELISLYTVFYNLCNADAVFNYGAPGYRKTEEASGYMEDLQKNLVMRVQKSQMLQNKAVLSIDKSGHIQPIDMPCDVNHRGAIDQKDYVGYPVSPFYMHGNPIHDGEIRNRLAEGVVSNVTGCGDEDGNFGCDIKQPRNRPETVEQEPRGEKPTVFKIHQEMFTFTNVDIEVSRDLQIMASGKDNRASNAFYTFCKYKHLFSHAKHGHDFKQVFRLLTFRNDLLLKELKLNSDMSKEMLASLDELLKYYKSNDLETWTFLYKIHVDVLQNLRSLGRVSVERENLHVTYTEQLKNMIVQRESRNQGQFYLAFLYGQAVLGKNDADTMFSLQCYLAGKATIDKLLVKNYYEGQILFDFGITLGESIQEILQKKGITAIDELLALRLPSAERTWEEIAPGVYKSGIMVFDSHHLTVAQQNQLIGRLPYLLRKDPAFIALFGNKAIEKTYTYRLVQTPLGKVWYVEITSGHTRYHLYLNDSDPYFPLVYRQKGEQWEQWVKIEDLNPKLPKDFKEGYYWVGSQEAFVENSKKEPIYLPQFQGDKLLSLESVEGNKKYKVLETEEASAFSQLVGQDGYRITKKVHNGKEVTCVDYLTLPLNYVWNAQVQRWESTLFHGYYLSNKPIEHWSSPKSLETHPIFFFKTHFKNFHLLDNGSTGKLVVPYVQYEKRVSKVVSEDEVKYAEEYQQKTEGSAKFFAVFDIEKEQLLTSKKPQDFLYLSYLLYIQGKYSLALTYLYRSQAVWTAANKQESALRDQIFSWFLDWNDVSHNAQTVIVHLLLMEHQLKEGVFLSAKSTLSLDNKMLSQLMEKADQYKTNQSAIEGVLRLNAEQEDILGHLAPRAISWCQNQLKSSSPSVFFTEDIKKYYQEHSPLDEKALLVWSLDRRIASLKVKADLIVPKEFPSIDKNYVPEPLFDIKKYLSPLKDSEANQRAIERSRQFVAELRDIYPDSDTSAAGEIGRTLADDIEYHIQKIESSWVIDSKADLKEIRDSILIPSETRYLKKEAQLRKQIIALFKPLDIRGPNLEQQLKEQESSYDQLFEKARFCFGLNDFSSLVSMGVLSQDMVETMNERLLEYEITRTDRKLISRKKEDLEKLIQNPGDPVLREETSSLLEKWCPYDRRKHPFAPLLLLPEDELNITLHGTQNIHCNHLIEFPDAYIHEAMAGGKTILLRNLFVAINSMQGYLAGVMTYGPLMAMHHKEFAAVNTLSQGVRVQPFYFDRNAPKDEVALKLMIIHHYHVFLEQGRIDQIPQAMISLNHSLTELIHGISPKDDKTIADLTPQIHALQDLLVLRENRLAIYSDEIDKNNDPQKDTNYSIAPASVLGEVFYKPALQILRELVNHPDLVDFKNAILTQKLIQMDMETFTAHIKQVAKVLISACKIPQDLDEKMLVSYLTETFVEERVQEAHLEVVNYCNEFQEKYNQDKKRVLSEYKIPSNVDESEFTSYLAKRFLDEKRQDAQVALETYYHETIVKYKDPEAANKLKILHYYIGILLKDLKTKLVGVSFGRSSNGVEVKPFSFSAVCQENSQRSVPLSTVFEICIDYMVSGVGVQAAEKYVERIKAIASEEIDDIASEETDDTNPKIDKTPTGKKFFQRFKVQLSKVKPKDYPAISECLEASYDLFEECLEEILFKQFTIFEQKIEGHSHLLSYLVKKLSGSSGSPERVKTLASAIRIEDDLKRQKGAIGSVFYNFFKGFDETQDLIPINLFKPVAEQLGPLLQPGDTFVDSVPFFPGQTGLETAKALQAYPAPGVEAYRYLDEQDQVSVLTGNQSRKGEEGLHLPKAVSIINHKGRQGTNWKFAPNTSGVIGVGHLLDLTSGYQSLLRLRLLGKGQKPRLAYDQTLTQQWEKVPSLQGKQFVTKLAWTLINNEERLIKKLHYQANRKTISVYKKRAFDYIERQVKDIKALAQIKSLPHFCPIQKLVLDPNQLGAPVLLSPPVSALESLRDDQKGALEALLLEINQLDIDESIKQVCRSIIQDSLNDLNSPKLIMDAKDLPELVPSNHSDNEATEEMEIELDVTNAMETEAQLHNEVQQELSLEVVMEASLENFDDVNNEQFAARPRETSPEGREWSDFAFRTHYCKLEEIRNDPANATIYSSHPNLFVSNLSLGLIDGERAQNVFKERTERVWFLSDQAPKQRMASKMFAFVDENKNMCCQIASVKESDFFFEYPLEAKRISEQWKYVSFKEAVKQPLSNFCYAQQKCISAAKDPTYGERYYNAMANVYERMKDVHVFKVDINEVKIPESLPQEHHREWVKYMTAAKFLYMEGRFSAEEKAYLDTFLRDLGIPLEVLERRLSNYLKKYYPSTTKNELLTLIREKRSWPSSQ